VPVNDIVAKPLDASLEMEAMAVKAPAAFGLKTTVTGVLCPAAIVTGRLGALIEKYFVEMVTLLTVTEAVPVFVTVTVKVLLVPAVTLPKSKLAPLNDKVPVCCCWLELLVLTPWQPTIIARQKRTIPSWLARLRCMAPNV
jgi:hypothetical protein